MFTQPFLNAYESVFYGQISGEVTMVILNLQKIIHSLNYLEILSCIY